ncbi:MAG: hypothetical protein ACOYMQ_12055 [Pseudanabaena sp.]|jgi:hypothetical protein
MEIDPNIPIQTQLAGLGQLRDLRTNPNLRKHLRMQGRTKTGINTDEV